MKLAELPDGLDFLLRPVVAGMVGYEHIDGQTLGLAHFAEMNDALNVDAENRARLARKP